MKNFLLLVLLALSLNASAQYESNLEIKVDQELANTFEYKAQLGLDATVIGGIFAITGFGMLQAAKWNANYDLPNWKSSGYALFFGGLGVSAIGTYNFASNKWKLRKIEKKYF